MSPPSSGKLVSSVAWKLRLDQLKPELMPVDVSHFGRKMKGVVSWDRSKEEQVEKEVSAKQPSAEPSRIKIFEGGYKSNEDYVYVRGRGRGKYICEECGIRCKKPSMLKKHIRTHTDVRPYVCKFCNFAFKTKDVGEEGQRCEKTSRVSLDHHPQPFSLPSMSITAMASSHPHLSHLSHLAHPSDLMGSANKPPLFGYFTTVPSIQITPQAPPIIHSQAEFQRNQLLSPPSMDEDLPFPDPSSRLSSPGLEISRCPSPISPSSSPSSRRYLSPRRDLSPCAGHLSPRRDLSPMRHISPKRDLAGGYRRDLSPRRGHLSLLSPLSRPTSPAGRDYKRDLSPRGRHRAMIRAVSPRRGLHQHLHHPSQQSGSRGLRQGHQAELGILGRQRTGTEMET
ncbi:Transcription factor HIVEP2, partial [Dissostichus eleginoides]